jgi:hypothetical protein
VSESGPVLEYFRSTPKTRLRVDSAPGCFSVTLPRPGPSRWLYIREFGQMLLYLALIVFLYWDIYDQRSLVPWMPLVVPYLYLGFEIFKSILTIRRCGIPTMLSITDGKLILLTPDQLRFRRIFVVDKDISVRPVRRWFSFEKSGEGQLYVERHGRKLARIFHYLSWPEIEWIANVINSALHPTEPV